MTQAGTQITYSPRSNVGAQIQQSQRQRIQVQPASLTADTSAAAKSSRIAQQLTNTFRAASGLVGQIGQLSAQDRAKKEREEVLQEGEGARIAESMRTKLELPIANGEFDGEIGTIDLPDDVQGPRVSFEEIARQSLQPFINQLDDEGAKRGFEIAGVKALMPILEKRYSVLRAEQLDAVNDAAINLALSQPERMGEALSNASLVGDNYGINPDKTTRSIIMPVIGKAIENVDEDLFNKAMSQLEGDHFTLARMDAQRLFNDAKVKEEEIRNKQAIASVDNTYASQGIEAGLAKIDVLAKDGTIGSAQQAAMTTKLNRDYNSKLYTNLERDITTRPDQSIQEYAAILQQQVKAKRMTTTQMKRLVGLKSDGQLNFISQQNTNVLIGEVAEAMRNADTMEISRLVPEGGITLANGKTLSGKKILRFATDESLDLIAQKYAVPKDATDEERIMANQRTFKEQIKFMVANADPRITHETWGNTLADGAVISSVSLSRDGNVQNIKDELERVKPATRSGYELYKKIGAQSQKYLTKLLSKEDQQFYRDMELSMNYKSQGDLDMAVVNANNAYNSRQGDIPIQAMSLTAISEATVSELGEYSNQPDINRKVYELAQSYVHSNGLNTETAINEAIKDIRNTHTPISGTMIYTRGANLPENIDIVVQFAIGEYVKKRGEIEGVTADDLTINPADNSNSLWRIVNKYTHMPVDQHSVAGFGTFTASQFAIIARAMDENEAALKNQSLLEKRGQGKKITNIKTLAEAFGDTFKKGVKMSFDEFTSIESYIGKTPTSYLKMTWKNLSDETRKSTSKAKDILSNAAGGAMEIPYLIGNYPIFGSDEEGNK